MIAGRVPPPPFAGINLRRTRGGRPLRQGTIVIVEDDAPYRSYLATLLREGGYDVHEVETGAAALETVSRVSPQVVLLDVYLPGLNGYEICRRLRDEFGGELAIAFISGTRTESYDQSAGLLVGADDYMTKSVAPDELLARVRALIRRTRPPKAAEGILTDREREVLGLLAAGLTQREIASRLVISPKTVGTHIERMFGKLGVRNSAQAVAVGYRLGLIGDGEPSAAEAR